MSKIAIVGLGNPGSDYVDTRHNAGFWMLDELSLRNGCQWKESPRFHSFTTILREWARPALLIKPLTFVNESGSYIKPLLKYHGCNTEDMIVVHDDVAFEPGRFKISKDGGDGGHKGIKDIIAKIGSCFIRFRLGIGKKSSRRSMTAHVLGKFSAREQVMMKDNFDFFSEALQRIVDKGVTHAMNLSNKREKSTNG